MTGYLTSEQAAEYLGFAAQTIIDWRHAGKGPAYFKVGASVRYCVTDLDAWMAAHKVGGSE